MILTRDYIAEIRIFYDFNDHVRFGRANAAKHYLERNEWVEQGGYSSNGAYQKVQHVGMMRYKKAFSDITMMEKELADIEDAFHNRTAYVDDRPIDIGESTAFNSKQLRV